jgi:hypothetical protein
MGAISRVVGHPTREPTASYRFLAANAAALVVTLSCGLSFSAFARRVAFSDLPPQFFSFCLRL